MKRVHSRAPWFLWVSICFGACAPESQECNESAAQSLLPIALLELESGQTRLHGFAGAAPPGTQGQVAGQVFEVDGNGGFTSEFDASYNDEVTFSIAEQPFTTHVKRAGDLCVPRPILNAGTLPNDIKAFLCDDEEGWLVTDSAENTLVFYGTDSTRVTLFEGEDFDQRGGSPHSVTPVGTLAMVSLFDHGGVALVDPCAGRVLDTARPALLGEPVRLAVSPPLELDVPADVNDTGEIVQRVSEMVPQRPQGLAAEGSDVFVAYSNFLQSTPVALYGPGYVAHFQVDGQRIIEMGGFEVDCQNVQSVTSTEAGWVASCSGILERVDGVFQSTSPGALFVFESATSAPRRIEFERFAPATPTLVGERWVVGSLLQKAVAVVPQSAASLSEGEILSLGDGIDSVFNVTALVGPLVIAPLFGEDRAVIVDVERLEVSPWPFEQGIALADDAALRGPLAVAKNGRDEFAILMGLSAEVFGLRFDSILESTP